MLKKFQKLVKLNLDDLALYLAVEGGLFLVIQIIIGCVMHFGRPDTSVTVSCILFPIVGGFTALIAGISHVGVSFDQALRFGQTRKRALGLTLGLCAFESAFALALGGVLAAVERFLCVPLWAKLAGMNGWVMGGSGVMEFADIVFGVLGFISMFLVFSVIRGFYHLILRLIRRRRGDEEEEEWEDEMAG